MNTVPRDGGDVSRSAVSRSATAIAVATAASRSLGLVRVAAITAALGTTYLGNTFQASNSVSNVVFELLAAGALSAVLVPTFVRLVSDGPREEVERVAGALWGLSLAVLGSLALVGVLAAPAIASVLTTSVDEKSIAGPQRELTTYLLRWFMPQVPLYALGAIATAVLHAHRRFLAAAVAPIGNTIAVVAAMVAFRWMGGSPDNGLSLDASQKIVLGLGGTAGVAAFVGIPALALRATGFRLRPRLDFGSAAFRKLLPISGWGVGLHMGAGMLLGAAIVVGNGVAGGVVAYQVALMCFLVPYAVLGQSIHTAVLPELSEHGGRGDLGAVWSGVRWGLRRMTLLLVPASIAMALLAGPVLRNIPLGETSTDGSQLIAAALVGLSAGLLPYSAFFLLARGLYALDDPRTPALVSVGAAAIGTAAMLLAGEAFDGRTKVLGMGLAHSLSYTASAAFLAVALRRRVLHHRVPGEVHGVPA